MSLSRPLEMQIFCLAFRWGTEGFYWARRASSAMLSSQMPSAAVEENKPTAQAWQMSFA